VKDKFNESFKHSIEFNERSHVSYSSPMFGCVMLYIYLDTGHSSNFLYCGLLIAIDCVRCNFHCSAILKLWPPTSCINRATIAKSTMPKICKSSKNILVTPCWQNVSIGIILMENKL